MAQVQFGQTPTHATATIQLPSIKRKEDVDVNVTGNQTLRVTLRATNQPVVEVPFSFFLSHMSNLGNLTNA